MIPFPGAASTRIFDFSRDDHTELARLTEWVDAFLSTPKSDLPRLPTAALEILDASSRPSTRTEDLAALVSRDAALAAKVLKLANSALYAGTSPVVELKGALIRLGLTTVRDVVVEAALQMTVCRTPGFQPVLQQVRRHSSAVAWVSRFVARLTPMEAENAFLIGLLHELGLNVALICAARGMKGKSPELTLNTWQAALTLHASLGARLLDSWKLPQSMLWVIGHHHDEFDPAAPAHPSLAVLRIAEAITAEAGWGLSPTVTLEAGTTTQVVDAELIVQDQIDRALSELRLTRKHYAMVKADTAKVLITLDTVLK